MPQPRRGGRVFSDADAALPRPASALARRRHVRGRSGVRSTLLACAAPLHGHTACCALCATRCTSCSADGRELLSAARRPDGVVTRGATKLHFACLRCRGPLRCRRCTATPALELTALRWPSLPGAPKHVSPPRASASAWQDGSCSVLDQEKAHTQTEVRCRCTCSCRARAVAPTAAQAHRSTARLPTRWRAAAFPQPHERRRSESLRHPSTGRGNGRRTRCRTPQAHRSSAASRGRTPRRDEQAARRMPQTSAVTCSSGLPRRTGRRAWSGSHAA
jgi:hypothetical protein